MKIIPLSIAKSYVAHWDWWEGIRELLQNAVDTGDFDVQTTYDGQIIINSRGGKIPVSALLMGKSGKADDEDTIGKFGEGMKLAFLVLGRLGADVLVHNDDECWRPSFQYSETFQEDCLVVGVYPAEKATGDVRIHISGVPESVIDLVEDRFIPLKAVEPIHSASNGEAYEKAEDSKGCNVYINGIFVATVKGRYKFDYNFRPSAFTLDRDRNTAKDFEVRWEASRLLMNAGEYILIAELASAQYDDVEHIRHHGHGLSEDQYEEMNDHACAMFIQDHGNNSWPIDSSWSTGKKALVSRMVIGKGYVPVEVNSSLYSMLNKHFNLDNEIEDMLDFRPINFLEKFLEDHKRNMRAKPVKKLEATIHALKTLRGY